MSLLQRAYATSVRTRVSIALMAAAGASVLARVTTGNPTWDVAALAAGILAALAAIHVHADGTPITDLDLSQGLCANFTLPPLLGPCRSSTSGYPRHGEHLVEIQADGQEFKLCPACAAAYTPDPQPQPATTAD